MRAPESPFQSYKSKRILSFDNLIWSSVSIPKALKNVFPFCHTQFQWKVTKKLWNVFEIVLEKCKVFVQKSLLLKEYFERKKSQTKFCCLCVILPTVKIWGNRTNSPWVLVLYSVRFKWKKLIRENSAKYVNQTGNFHFWPKLKTAISLPIFNLFQWFLFYIRGFIWIIT